MVLNRVHFFSFQTTCLHFIYNLKMAIILIFMLLINDLIRFPTHHFLKKNQTELFKILAAHSMCIVQ